MCRFARLFSRKISTGSPGASLRPDWPTARGRLVCQKIMFSETWVEDEVDQAFEEEQKREQVVLFPVRLDDEFKTTDKPWTSKLRRARHIGDFTRWKDHDAYTKSFDRVLRDLKVSPAK
jgi:hypothetical protein